MPVHDLLSPENRAALEGLALEGAFTVSKSVDEVFRKIEASRHERAAVCMEVVRAGEEAEVRARAILRLYQAAEAERALHLEAASRLEVITKALAGRVSDLTNPTTEPAES